MQDVLIGDSSHEIGQQLAVLLRDTRSSPR